MESNISRDHIALEAMKTLIIASAKDNTHFVWRIARLFGKGKCRTRVMPPAVTARFAYMFADAMIEERNKINEE